MTKERTIETYTVDWQGITLSVSFEADWMNTGLIAHLQIRAIKPQDIGLPITDTGYRSRFLQCDEVANAGGAVAYVLAWLDHAAKSPQWRAQPQATGQPWLF